MFYAKVLTIACIAAFLCFLSIGANKCNKLTRFQCPNEESCFPKSWLCDGEPDCRDGSDEKNCKEKKCASDEFRCKNKRCIPDVQKCDSIDHCGDNSDEDRCSNSMDVNWLQLLLAIFHIAYFGRVDTLACDSSEMQCRNGACISVTWKCDGEDDCGDNSDEDACSKKVCGSTEFACKNGRCIPQAWTCDKADDCGDNSDESATEGPACSIPTCAPTDFQCNLTKVCLKEVLRCDGRRDCGSNDNSDEEGCEPTCKATEFKCDNSKCIDAKFRCNRVAECGDNSDEKSCNLTPCQRSHFKCNVSGHCIEGHLRCDGSRDCLDGSDEVNCPTTTKAHTTPTDSTSSKAKSTTPKPCPFNHFKCKKNGKCIHSSWLCDGEADCVDGEDESKELCDKRTCSPSQFACKNGKCILSHFKCDSIDHCGDNSDEEKCGTLKPTRCTATTFTCGASGTCIEQSLVCDGTPNCPNSEDEPASCGKNECQLGNHGCTHNCTDLKIGYKCSCMKGYHLHADNKTCINTNECHEHGMCSQKCIDLKGSYKCLCFDGYYLDGDMKTCRASGPLPQLMIAMRSDIRQLQVDGQHYKTVVHTRFIKAAMSLDVDIQNKMLYLADLGNHSIVKASLDNADKVEHIIKNVQKPEGLAFDWIAGNIYWSSTHPKYQGAIEVAKSDGSSRSVLVHTKVDEPRAVAVHPLKRLLFWTDWGKHPRIECVSMDGLQRQVVIDSSHLTWPNGLTIDFSSDRIFWTDSKRNNIGSSNLDGSHIVIVASDIHNPYGITVFEDSVYWTNYKGGQIFRANKFTGSNKREYQDEFFAPMDLQIVHPLLQKIAINPCAVNNGGCTHLCLLSSVKPDGYSCACPTDVKLYPDGRHCDIVYPTATVAFTTDRKDLVTPTISTSLKGAMDLLIENCFFQAILDAKKIELPMLVTKFSAQYLHPACPEEQKIDVKKSKYKKMSKFLQEMESRGLVKVAELSKGVLGITELSVEHECLRAFKASPFARDRKVAKEEAKSKETAELAKENQGIVVLEMFAVSGKTQTFFKHFQKSKGDAMTATEIRELITGYVKDNELNSKTDRRRVILDPILSDVLFDKDFIQESVTWDILFTRFMNKMNPCHKTVISGKESKLKKGKIEPIEVKLQQRTGNKKVTLVQNLEHYGIDPSEFAHQIQLSAASSTTVNSSVDKSSSSQQVLIQGNQTAHVAKLLDDLKVPRKYINGLDEVKSSGKKR